MELPFRALADHEVVFLAENLPPLGYRCYYFERMGDRKKRAIIVKNVKRRKNKKYLIRQVNSVEGPSLLKDLNEYEYFDDDESTTTEAAEHEPKTSVIFQNMTNNTSPADTYTVTPVEAATRTTEHSFKTTSATTVPIISTTVTGNVNDTNKPDLKAKQRQIATEPVTATTKKQLKEEFETSTQGSHPSGDNGSVHDEPAGNSSDYILGLPNTGFGPMFNHYRKLADMSMPTTTTVETATNFDLPNDSSTMVCI